jgi:hypothetical protein
MSYVGRMNVVPLTRVTPGNLRDPLHRVMSGSSPKAVAVVDAMLLAEGGIGTAGSVAAQFGLRNRFDLANWLTREGLPPLHELAGWVSVLLWIELCTRTGMSLCDLALRRGRDPAACYRLVQRVTGQKWSTVRARGTGWVLDRFAARCRERQLPANGTGVGSSLLLPALSGKPDLVANSD